MDIKEILMTEVAKHNTPESCWIVIDDVVYDVTKFLHLHPGSDIALIHAGGTDATEDFYGLHKASVLNKWGPKLAIGKLAGPSKSEKPTSRSEEKLSVSFPYEEARSLFQTKEHLKFRLAIREIMERELRPLVEGDIQDLPEKTVFERLGQSGFFASILGQGRHLQMLLDESPGFSLPSNLSPGDFSIWHELICQEEIARLGSLSVKDAVVGGLVVGLPPVLNYGSEEALKKVALPVLQGKQQICLAITEPYAGSDVSAIRTTAKKSPCGKYFLVTGTKKWITQGAAADWFCTLARSESGMCLLAVPRTDRVTTTRIRTSYSPAAGTSFVVFNEARVPVEMLLGNEGEGFQNALSNFTHERWAMLAAWNRMSRLVVTDCLKWAHVRKTFGGKRLIDQPVIQDKMARMIASVEGVQHWIENITYRISQYPSYAGWSRELAGEVALLKLHQTRVATFISDESVQVFGGRGLTRSGMGSNVERFMRTFKYGAVTGGSEEIMASYGIRQLMKEISKSEGVLARM